jgi:hypothetical protein
MGGTKVSVSTSYLPLEAFSSDQGVTQEEIYGFFTTAATLYGADC